MSKRRRDNERPIERPEPVARPITELPRAVQPIAAGVGVIVAAVIGLIGWAAVQALGSQTLAESTNAPSDDSIKVVPSSDSDGPSFDAGSSLQNAPNQSTGGSPSSQLQPSGGEQSSNAELFNQTEHGDIQIKTGP